MIRDGATIVIPTSFGYSDPTKAILEKHPEIDIPAPRRPRDISRTTAPSSPTSGSSNTPPDVPPAETTQSNKLGFIAAFPIPSSMLNINAFHLGAQSVNPDVETTVVFTSDWCDPGKAGHRGQRP